jgi:hypothetical protein
MSLETRVSRLENNQLSTRQPDVVNFEYDFSVLPTKDLVRLRDLARKLPAAKSPNYKVINDTELLGLSEEEKVELRGYLERSRLQDGESA